MNVMNNKIVIDGVSFVPTSFAIRLKKLGWNEKTLIILRVRTSQVIRPIKSIDCTIGEGYAYIPSISQVISWLEKRGIIFDYSYSKILREYTSAIIISNDSNTTILVDDEDWKDWDSLMITLIEKSIEYLENERKES